MLLLDVVKSTEMIKREGDTFLMRQMRVIHDAIRAHPVTSELRFMKFTGDGFLVLFAGVTEAIRLAQSLRSLASSHPWKLRFVIHQGAVRFEFEGDPIGTEVHRLFRIEALDQSQCISPASSRTFPEHSYPVITPEALRHLPDNQQEEFELLGDFSLKGFDEPQQLWVEKLVD